MKKNDNRSEQTDPPASSKQTLRRRAEEMAHSPEELEAMSPEETQQTLHELRVHQIELEIQNEELRWVQAELEAERARYFELYDLAPVSYFTISEEGLITEINLTAANLLGVPQGTLTKQPISCFIFEEDQDIYYLHRKQFLEVSEPLGCELRMKKKDGTIFWAEMETTIEKNVDGAPVYRTMLIDITERKQAEATQQHRTASQALLLEISNKFNNVLTEDIDAIITATLQMIGEFDCADRSYTAVFSDDQSTISNTHGWCAEGITAAIDSIRGLPVDRVFPWLKDNLQSLGYTYIPRVADLPPEAQAEKEMLQAQSIQSFIAVPIFMDDKILGFLGCDSVRVEKTWSEDNIIMLKSVAQITSKAMLRQQFAQALQASENYYRTIFENTGAATMIIEEDMTISRVNADWERAFGFKNEDLITKKWTDFVVGDMVENMKEYHLLRRIDPTSAPSKYISQVKDKQGKIRDGLTQVDIIPGTNKSVATFIDVTDFNRIDRAYKATSVVNQTMLRAETEEELLRIVCQKVVEVGGYSMAGVAYLQADPQQTLQPVASAGNDNGYLAKLDITLQDPLRGQGPTATAIRTSQPVVCGDFVKDDTFKPWLEDALQWGFKSSMSIPLMAENKAFGALIIYSNEIGRFDSDEEKLLAEMANDLAFGIMSLRNRIDKYQTAEELKISLEKMRRILMQAVSSLGATLDTRDPYTAGHQRKVALLAAAIAEEMGLFKDIIDGITVTGNLHDIGKTNVPSEILSKPGKLTDIEFALIKVHPQSGYDIVKDIEFPWPVAEILLQHHERLDGSGYPRGLAGEDILMEARIIAVADVVEAMASHRPYRPALGIDAALQEITRNRDTLYDPDVVDTCLKLFNDQGFELEQSAGSLS